MKILVTGSEGFIGSHLVESLIKKGHHVKAFVFYNSYNSAGWLDLINNKIKNNIEIIFGDIRDSYSIKRAMNGCDSIIHLAALISIPYSYESPESYVDTNIKGTLNVLQAARELNINRIIHTSTSEVYGTPEIIPIDETHKLQGQSPYSASKISADQLAFSFYSSFSLPVVTIRPFNTYGPRQSARAVIPSIISQILLKKRNLRLGTLYTTRDFNYVSDIVNGFELALFEEKVIGEVINLGNNFEISILDLVKTISQIMGVEINIDQDSERIRPENSEVLRLKANNQKAKSLLNWQPEYSEIDGLKKGLIKTIEWFSDKSNINNYKVDIYNK